MRRRASFGSIVAWGCGLAACGGGQEAGRDAGATAAPERVGRELTSIWENDTPELAYAYAENIHDGRGYTSGYVGFCTGTGDAIQVVACYGKRRSEADGNKMAKYMPALVAIDDAFQSSGQDQGDTSTLDAIGDWVKDWAASEKTAATRADFSACQDQIVTLLYDEPSVQAAQVRGLTTALTRASLYDAWINQGGEGGADLAVQTDSALGLVGKVGSTITEDAWLKKFLELRLAVLAGDSTWKDSVDRAAGYEKARRRGNFDLAQPIDSNVKAQTCWPNGTYLDSGYTPWAILPDGSYAQIQNAAEGCQ
ncbi:MAG: chitosanase [Polyangia bacterium]